MEIIEKRRSIRKYKRVPVDDATVLKLLKSACLAPSGSNTQPWHFIIIVDEDLKEKIVSVSHDQKWMLTAPIFIACVADVRSRIEHGDVYLDEESGLFELKQIIRDTAIAIHNLILEAVDNDLGTCWVAWYEQNKLRPVLGIPDDKFVVGIVTLGYADEDPQPRPRKNIEELIHRNKW